MLSYTSNFLKVWKIFNIYVPSFISRKSKKVEVKSSHICRPPYPSSALPSRLC